MGSQPSRGRERAYIPSLMATKLWRHHQKRQTEEIEHIARQKLQCWDDI